MGLEETLSMLRAGGWSVAVHNDYRLNGERMTFWLFTHAESGLFIKGEGKTDMAALAECNASACKLFAYP